ncbi:MAG TPA: superoxide dismutase [Beijerinckiaceae bacterium]|nr:superoxide dismutase [Beijerinckiaceae bacterium]
MSTLHRRAFIAAATATLFAPRASAQAPAGPYTRAPLPYAFNALEPHIDAKTMEIHSGRHHEAYVTNMNGFAKDGPEWSKKSITEVLANLNALPEAIRTGVRNNLGGHANHTMFWQIMAANGGKPEGDVLAAIDRDLGGVEKMMTDFNASGLRVFGSGWTFITVAKDGKLAIVNKPNQDTPIMDGQMVLLGNDVWEHAYYLNYQNRRADYLKAWWNVVNWKAVGARFAAAKAGTLAL